MTALGKLEERIAKLEAASDRMASETRAAHEAIGELRKLRAEIKTLLSKDVRRLVEEAVAAEVGVGLDEYRSSVETAIAKADLAVEKRFKQLANLYLTGGTSGRGAPLFSGRPTR